MQTFMIVANINVGRSNLEFLEASKYATIRDAIAAIEEATGSKNHEDFGIYTMSDFMDMTNNQEIDLDNHWLGYVFCEDDNSQLTVTLKRLCDA